MRAVLMAAVASLGLGCAHVEGSFRMHDPAGKAGFELTPSSCSNGLKRGFPGVLFVSENERRIEVAYLRERVRVPGTLRFVENDRVLVERLDTGEETAFTAAECQLFQGEMSPTTLRVNGVPALEGFVRLRCESSDGALFEGDVRFDNCSI